MNYQQTLTALLAASGQVETAINSNGGNQPTAEQSVLLTFLQNELKNAIEAAQNDPNLPQ
jgi:hypothetical protein